MDDGNDVRDPARDRPARRSRRPPASRATSRARPPSATTRSAVAIGFADAGARWLHVVDLDGARTGAPAHGGVDRERSSRRWGSASRVEVAGGLRTERAVGVALEAGPRAPSSGRPRSAIRRSRPSWSTRTAPSASPSPSMSATAAPSATAGSPATAGIDADEAISRLGRRRASRPSRSPPSSATASSAGRTSPSTSASSGSTGARSSRRAASRHSTTSGGRAVGCRGAIVGRALYEGRMSLRDAIEQFEDRGD